MADSYVVQVIEREYYTKYVGHDELEEYEAQGWTVADGPNLEGTNHGEYSIIMRAPEGWTPESC